MNELHDRVDEFDGLPPGRILPLPPGVYTLLPLAEQCDNLGLPVEQEWTGQACKRRWDNHVAQQQKPSTPAAAGTADDSALADDDDDEQDEVRDPTDGSEFLTPLFLALPTPPPAQPQTAPQHRRSSASSQRPAFTAMTPMTPSLRPSSPTPSGPSPYAAPAPTDDEQHKTLSSQPIGFLRPSIVRALIEDNRRLVSMNCKPVWAFQPPIAFPPPPPKTPERRRSSIARSRSASIKMTRTQSFYEDDAASGSTGVKLEDVLQGLKAMAVSGGGSTSTTTASGPWAVGFEDWINAEGPEARREHIDRIVRGWKAKGLFPECLGGEFPRGS